MSEKNRPTPRRADAQAAQRETGARIRAALGIPTREQRHRDLDAFEERQRLRLKGRATSGILINPARDFRSAKSGRLRRELAVALEHRGLGPEVVEFTEEHLDFELDQWQKDWILRYYAARPGSSAVSTPKRA